MILAKASPRYLFKLYDFYLYLEHDYEARRFYRYLPMKTIKNKLYAIVKLTYDLVIPLSILPQKTVYYMILSENNVVGVCHITLYRRGKAQYSIYGIALSKGIRGKGLAKILSIYALIDVIYTFKQKNIYLYVDLDNTKAIRLYRKLGFKEVAIVSRYDYRYIEGKYIDAYLMKLDINAFVKYAKGIITRKVK